MSENERKADVPEAGPTKSEAAKREEAILEFWKENRIFEKSLEKPAPNGDYIFYEGPPTANGRPGVHHIESRSFKDALPRYKTMRGYRVPRRAGWDTHGLPVELEVEKEIGSTGKKDIEVFGIAAFNKKCRESVMRYVNEWQRFSDRIGYWVNQETAYFTYDSAYMESVFSIMKKVSDDGQLYKDYRIVPWCARCGTALSTHELAQGYSDVKDLSVTARFELVDEPGTYFLAWTTTPWTLPGNVGLAVGETVTYAKYQKSDDPDGEKVILAKVLAEKVLGEGWTLIEEMQGSALVGKKYIPLYSYAKDLAPESEKGKFDTTAFQVYPASFVTTEDGTGIVHTAVMYGQEDFELGQKVGLPKVHLVAADGTFIPGTGFLEGRFVKDEEVAVDIVKDLAGRTPKNLLFDKAKYEHSYPFCWRCKTPLIYYARDSWYIRMSNLRPQLLEENSKVNWEPAHIRDGRMGEWLRGDKDWAISRERYWGTPLPVWQNEDGSERIVVGSIDEIRQRTKKSGNMYFMMRHGEAENNILGINSTRQGEQHHLTEKGFAEVKAQVALAADKNIDLIFVSPFIRTQETAEILRAELGLSSEQVIVDARLSEINVGVFDGKLIDEYHAWFQDLNDRFSIAPEGAENFDDVRRRMGAFLYELESKYQGKNILIVSHGGPLWLMKIVVNGTAAKNVFALPYPQHAAFEMLPFVPLPHNDVYELDLHRPYIDDVVLVSDSGVELSRVKEVMDVWLDSGAMPFAEDHYPFENKEWIETKGYPADFISEAIDQTRGWFYTLLAVGVLMGRGAPYKNVICLGHLLDGNGQKMSKSKGNVIDPWLAIDEWGVDTLRFWMYSVNQPGDSKNFDVKTVRESARTLSWFENSVRFYELFKDNETKTGREEVIDRWMKSRVAETVATVTKHLDAYELYDGTRAIAKLLEDLSQWYVRRVRDRVRDGDAVALATLRETLVTCSQLLAPFAPFIAEWAFGIMRTDLSMESVHLSDWPVAVPFDEVLIADMARLRVIASEALMLRQKVNVKVRQPLAKLSIVGELAPELAELLKEEVNVKEIVSGAAEMQLDMVLTAELVREGDIREFTRALADARKEKGLAPKDTVSLTIDTAGEEMLKEASLPGVSELSFGEVVDGSSVELSIGKVAFVVHLSSGVK